MEENILPWEYQTTRCKRVLLKITDMGEDGIKIYGPETEKTGINIKITTSGNAIEIRLEKTPDDNKK